MKGIYHSDTLMQLFVQGPTWDGNLVSKQERDAMVQSGLCERWDGWNWLTGEGVEAAVAGGLASDNRAWRGKAAKQ